MIHLAHHTYDTYDQSWLLRGTWIDWFTFDQDGRYVPLWNSQIQSNTVSPLVQQLIKDLDSENVDWESTEKRHEDGEDEGDDGADKDDDDDDDDDDEESCPTYGHSSHHSLFGRFVHEDPTYLLGHPRETSASYTVCSRSEPGILYFCAPTIVLQAGRIMTMPPILDYPVSPLLDKHYRNCGCLSICNQDSWLQRGDRTVKLVITSLTSYGDLSLHHAAGHISAIHEGYGVDNDDMEQYLETVPNSVNRFESFNVLFAQPNQREVALEVAGERKLVTVHERAGMGFIHREALRHLDEAFEWQDIILT